MRKKCYKASNSSKSVDLVMRVAPILQAIEMAADFIENNPLFAASKLEEFLQPLLPGANVVREEFVAALIRLISASQQ